MKPHWLFLSAVGAVGICAGACASKVGGSSTSGATSGPASSGAASGGSSAASTGAGGSTSASTGGGTCSKPGTLHPPQLDTTKTIYCPFSGSPNVYCEKQKQHCCEPQMAKTGEATCKPIATQCAATDTDWQCQDPTDCLTGDVCCSNDGATLVINTDMNCANYATGMKGTQCAKSCVPTTITMCTAAAQCGAKKCTPFSKAGAQVGGCK